MTTILSDNLTQVLLAVIAIVGTTVNLVVTWILAQKQNESKRRIHSLENTEQPNSEDVAEMYNVAEKTLEAVNKLLRKHGRSIQSRAELMAKNAELLGGVNEATTEQPRRRGGLRRVRRKTSETQEKTSIDDHIQ